MLLLSAPVGEGHVAAARALAARMRTVWPDAAVTEVETVAGGPRRTALLGAAYRLVMRAAPGLYGFAYDVLGRLPRLASVLQRLGAPATARALRPVLAAQRPDLVVCTYPVTSGGLALLHRRGELDARTVAIVTDPAVHPFWVWPDVDETWVMLDEAAAAARRLGAGDVRVVPPVVDARFVPGPAPDGDELTVLVTGGSLGFGSLEHAVDAVLDAGSGVRAVVLCGHNDGLRARLDARADPRLRTLGWTDTVPAEMAAADAVLTTGGGMIASEALAVGRPVLFATPVPGHGRAGARALEHAGLAVVCPRPADVTTAVVGLRDDPSRREALAAAARAFSARDLDGALAGLAERVLGRAR
ncbi:galactosyldiacylglycerol synthase [Actinomycetospora endophytica]|uniref:Galactosyldiacylglycerol synthase n=1 Tax=Actinomycetospora endophytica TaxID=2291215 RepID=A0ABS8P7S9_9PSEU|nr:glycosyltransferase [Actinomycetospora endophytica]MCD2194309.1 galactosyldiacylglycerol synthase [Actinomycetospora endophytica]